MKQFKSKNQSEADSGSKHAFRPSPKIKEIMANGQYSDSSSDHDTESKNKTTVENSVSKKQMTTEFYKSSDHTACGNLMN